MFLSVRERLEANSYIINVVLEGKMHYGMRPDDHVLLLKLFGYSRGADAVDAVLDYIHNPPVVPKSLAEYDTDALRKLRDKVALKTSILALTTPAEAASPAVWLLLADRFASRRRERGNATQNEAWAAWIRSTIDAAGCPSAATPNDLNVQESREGQFIADHFQRGDSEALPPTPRAQCA